MMASFHVIEYRAPRFSPPRRLVGAVEGLRFWRPLDIGGDFAFFRRHPTRRALYPKLRPDFRRWAFYGVWEDEAALDRFLEHSPVSRSWRDHATEAWHVWLEPIEVRGPWAGMQLLGRPEPPPPTSGPVAHLVRLDLTLRGTVAMWGWAAPGVLAHVPDDDEMLVGLPLVDRPYMQPSSFSLWRSTDAARAFAYRNQGHRDAIDRVAASQKDLYDRHSSGSFRPYRSEGTWHGRNPLERAALG